ncbi:alpha/beta fold hydrolase [Kribbella sp. CA-293567]|uniref:alpha/beta fold hydrolase n=1 Tax=Kribbella sp. CA-293567 TaxID=3002436 RepID=UPI0022DE1233|nr:alpha/beta hydrolase [Kribbella sp. CA-293567]WBQ06783.1 alpha/beta hydrolase [Kribbella sp. CA-293567]
MAGRTLWFRLYGPADGVPVIELYGTPSTRLRRPGQIAAIEESGVRVLTPDRPGYGGSTRQPGRTVSDVVQNVEVVADSQGWETFAVVGGSGGGPHALACAALLPHRVTRCAVLSGIRPQAATLPPEEVLRAQLAQLGADILGQVEAGGHEYPGAPPGPPAWDDPAAQARLLATFADSLDGWYDDKVAFAQPWGFSPQSISVPVGIWYGTHDENVPESDAQWLLENIPTAEGHQYIGGHLPTSATLTDIYNWTSSPGS